MDYKEQFYSKYSSTQANVDIKTIYENLEQRKPYFEKIIKNYFPKKKDLKILDLGCGYGAFVYFLENEGYLNVEGIDTSVEQVKLANELGLKNVYNGDLLEKLKSLSDNSYDFIISFDVLEHFNKNEVVKIVKEVYRILKSDGKYIVHVPNGEAIFSGVVLWGDFTHELAFTRKSIEQIAKVTGFKNFNFYEDEPIIHGFKSIIRYILWKIFRFFFHVLYVVETGNLKDKIILSQNILAIMQK